MSTVFGNHVGGTESITSFKTLTNDREEGRRPLKLTKDTKNERGL